MFECVSRVGFSAPRFLKSYPFLEQWAEYYIMCTPDSSYPGIINRRPVYVLGLTEVTEKSVAGTSEHVSPRGAPGQGRIN